MQGGDSLLLSITRYSIFCLMQIIISFILTLTQKTTWEIPQKVLDSVFHLGYGLKILMIIEIVIFVVDFKTFISYSLFWKLFYLLPISISLAFIFILSIGEVGILFHYRANVFLSENIWGSIVGVLWSVILIIKHYSLR